MRFRRIRGVRRLRRAERRHYADHERPEHPHDLGRVFVHETQPSIAIHQLWEMERRTDTGGP